ncbi:MAG: prepilin-type N-terminal cleavage/methylation domain-containing protein [Planctomycetota bacterium]
MRHQRGLTLLEILITTSLLATLLLSGFGLLDSGNKMFNQGSIKQLTQMQAQRVLDKVAEDFTCCAGWQLFDLALGSTSEPTGSGIRLSKFYYGQRKLTGGFAPASPTTYTPFTFTSRDASTNAVAFLRIRDANILANTSGYGAYLVHDFEPRQAPGTAFADVGADGNTKADNQPGRMNDDPARQYIYYRTRIANRRVIVERVRGVPAQSISNDGADNPAAGSSAGLDTTSRLVELVGDLGPAATANGGALPVGVVQGSLTIDGIDASNTISGVGEIHIKVTAKGLSRKETGLTEVIVGEAETIVSIPAGMPPY